MGGVVAGRERSPPGNELVRDNLTGQRRRLGGGYSQWSGRCRSRGGGVAHIQINHVLQRISRASIIRGSHIHQNITTAVWGKHAANQGNRAGAWGCGHATAATVINICRVCHHNRAGERIIKLIARYRYRVRVGNGKAQGRKTAPCNGRRDKAFGKASAGGWVNDIGKARACAEIAVVMKTCAREVINQAVEGLRRAPAADDANFIKNGNITAGLFAAIQAGAVIGAVGVIFPQTGIGV